jgi:(1->4)-alpha-D-glucan 1-alpha-D-glucosylmutase
LTRRLLDIRRRYGPLFTEGGYEPLAMTGAHAAHVIGFARHSRQQRIIALVGRHFARVTDGGRRWPAQIDVRLELERKGQWQNLLTDEVIGADALTLPMTGLKVPIAVYAIAP